MEINSVQTFYELLDISQDATLEEIKNAYRKVVTMYHPDVNPKFNNRIYHDLICKINEAYKILRNIELRKEYDKELTLNGKFNLINKIPSKINCYFNENKYNYYNECDYDYYNQKDFIGWIEEFLYDYIRCAMSYYQQFTLNHDMINKLYSDFNDIIILEKKFFEPNIQKINKKI